MYANAHACIPGLLAFHEDFTYGYTRTWLSYLFGNACHPNTAAGRTDQSDKGGASSCSDTGRITEYRSLTATSISL